MLGALAGAESLEILVMLKDLSEQGFKRLEGNIKHAETTANRVNYSGFSKKTKGLAADAEAAAGRRGGGGLGALLTGFTGLPGPVAAAGLAIGAFAAISAATIPVYERVEQQEKALDTAFRKHGSSLDALRTKVDAAIVNGEQYAYSAGDTREAILKLALAGHKWADIQAALPRIMDLARAKHLDLAEAARMYELALMGNQRALKDLGIVMPAITKKVVNLKDAKVQAKIADQELSLAVAKLTKLEHGHAVTTTKVTESVNAHAVVTQHVTHVTKGHTASVEELKRAQIAVEKATLKSKAAHEALAEAQGKGAKQVDRLTLLNQKLDGSVGDQRGTVTQLQKAQAKLNDAWERFSTTIGPALVTALGFIVDKLAGLVDILTKAAALIGQIDSHANQPTIADLNNARNPHGSSPKPPAKSGPQKSQPGNGHGKAAGGWVGLTGPEWTLTGERGPEYVVPNHKLGHMGGGHGHAIYLDGVKVGKALDHLEYWHGLAASGSGNRG